ncbi:TolC family protein [Puteibacter caeruleilacunae]|nr:TolC family protein [Puteibacter caeruleilacunae]
MKHNIQLAVITTLTLLMGACGIHSNYTTPELKKKQFVGEQFTLPDSSIVELPSWENVFVDSSLRVLIEKALEANSDLRIASLNIAQAESMLQTAKFAFLPSLGLSPKGEVRKFGDASYARSYSLPLTTSWEIDVFGKLRYSKEQAKSVLEQSREYEQMVRTQLIANVAVNYYSLVMFDAQLEITEESALTLYETLNCMKSLKEVGLQNDAAVRQAAANYKRIEISLEELRKQISICENNISLLINQIPQKIKRNAIGDVDLNADFKKNISLKALANRPDVRYAELRLRESFYGVSYARASLYPTIKLSGSIGWTNNAGVIANPGDMLFSALASLTQPIFMAGVNKANLKIAKAKYEQQLIGFEKSLLRAGNEINDALMDCEIAKRKQVLRSEEMDELRYAVEVTKDLMKNGQVNYLEVLTAQNALLSSRINYSVDWFELVKGKISLYKSLGGHN